MLDFKNVDEKIQIEYCQLKLQSKLITTKLQELEKQILIQSRKDYKKNIEKEIKTLYDKKESIINGGSKCQTILGSKNEDIKQQ